MPSTTELPCNVEPGNCELPFTKRAVETPLPIGTLKVSPFEKLGLYTEITAKLWDEEGPEPVVINGKSISTVPCIPCDESVNLKENCT